MFAARPIGLRLACTDLGQRRLRLASTARASGVSRVSRSLRMTSRSRSMRRGSNEMSCAYSRNTPSASLSVRSFVSGSSSW